MDNAKNNTPKKVIISTAIGIVSMLIIIVGATYAYWNAKGTVNFNTATITYETEDKSIIVLNGTTGLLTLGTIEGTDMPKVANNIVYYAGEEDKSRTPQEVTIGVATYDEEDDRNIYRCTFTLALTHGGSADLIDRFLSDGYTNRSEGQIIITVNGVEYDINDGFPSTITGYTDVDIYHPGSINVGMKFVNIGTLNQDYLIETNGHININVTSFNCQAKKELAINPNPQVKYWSFVKDDSLLFNGTGYSPIQYYSRFTTTSRKAKKFDSYYDLVNMTLYGVTAPNMPRDIDYLLFYTNGGRVNDLFDSLENCQSFLSMVLNDDSLTTDHGDIYSYDYRDQTVYDKNTFTCSPIHIENPFFFRESTPPVVSEADKWEIFYTDGVYLSEEECEADVIFAARGGDYPNDKSYCIYHNGYYYLQRQETLVGNIYDDISDLIDTSYLIHTYNNTYDRLLFNSEEGCESVVDDYYEDTYYDRSLDIMVDAINECIQTRTAGETYYDTTIDMCIYKNNKLTCLDINDDSFIEDFIGNTNYLNDEGFYCEYQLIERENLRNYERIDCGYDENDYASFSFNNNNWGIRSFAGFRTRDYQCNINQEYVGVLENVCQLIYAGGLMKEFNTNWWSN